MGEIISGSFSGAFPLLRARPIPYIVLIVLGALVGLGMPALAAWFATLPPTPGQTGGSLTPAQVAPLLALYPALFLGSIAQYFIIPAAMRTVKPEFGMTIGRLFGLLGMAVAVAIAVELGFFLFIVPGVWFAVKWSQYIWTFLMNDREDPLDESWRITTGHFWETFGFLFLIGMIASVLVFVVMGVIAGLSALLPQGGVVFVPIGLAIYIYAVAFVTLAQLRWMLYLRTRAGAALGAAVATV
jgi:hypothetical protein